MVRDKRKRGFKGSVSRNAAKQARGKGLAHLNLPKGVSMFREEAKTRISLDILPYKVSDANHPDRDEEFEIALPGELWYKRPYWMHRNIGPTNEAVVCPASAKEKCPICDHRAQMMKEGADWNDETVKALKHTMRNLYVVIPLGHKSYEEKAHIWDTSQFLVQEKINEEIGENEEYETFPDLEEGYTLQIRFTEAQLGTNKFAEVSRIDFKKRTKPYKEAILDGIPDLDKILQVPSSKAVESLFFGGMSLSGDESKAVEEPDEGEKEERRRPTSHRHREEPEEDLESEDGSNNPDEPEAEPEEEEKPAPPPTITRRRKEKESDGKPSAMPKCPSGHKFGKDFDEYKECNDCELWEACMDASGK